MNQFEEALDRVQAKFRKSMEAAAWEGIIPYKSEKGAWVVSPYDGNSWWTGGFWPGLMWQLYVHSGEECFLREARRVGGLLTDEFRVFSQLNHDVGFMYLLSCGADYKLTGDKQAGTDTLHAASLLMGRFNPKGYITGDPRFAHCARVHADTTLREFLREDGSVSHIIEFDSETGKRVREHPGQGYALGSSWSRGQAWGLYGFTLAYLNTKDEKYLDAAKRIAAYFTAHIRPDGLTDSDFCQPAGEERIDNLAGAIGACGLMELGKATGDSRWQEAAEKLVRGMLEHCADWTEEHLGILTHCTASYHDDGAGRHTNIIYGDYFLTEALMKLTGKRRIYD